MSATTISPKDLIPTDPSQETPAASARSMGREGKYSGYLTRFPISLPDRTWPDRQVTRAPRWCSVDLRDGNQALINPMNLDQKLELFKLLLDIGFKEIEVSFPSAAEVEFDFTRKLIDDGLIPHGVMPQVLTQARAHLIDRTFEALKGAEIAIVHMYNSTSELQRRVVFGKSREEITELAVEGAKRIKKLASQTDTRIVFQYSPESFTGTEMEYAVEICRAVMDVWEPTAEDKMIVNLPSTVEMATPNVYADMIEWFQREIGNRDTFALSLHTHNDRGTGVAATELAMLAGADRVEGTLFGNGERTGNVDIVNVALNLYTQGVEPELDLSRLMEIREVTERCTELPVHPRHPYAGDLVFAAFSGSHQDAINKGFRALGSEPEKNWEVPYFIIDPGDIGRRYESVIRINSQSGKGGVAFVMQSEFGLELPKEMQPEFSKVVQKISETTGKEVMSSTIWEAFSRTYLELVDPYEFVSFRSVPVKDHPDEVYDLLTVRINGEERVLNGQGNGPINACVDALHKSGGPEFQVVNYWEHARSSGSDAEAAAYLQVRMGEKTVFGVGIHPNTSIAAIRAILSGVNRAIAAQS